MDAWLPAAWLPVACLPTCHTARCDLHGGQAGHKQRFLRSEATREGGRAVEPRRGCGAAEGGGSIGPERAGHCGRHSTAQRSTAQHMWEAMGGWWQQVKGAPLQALPAAGQAHDQHEVATAPLPNPAIVAQHPGPLHLPISLPAVSAPATSAPPVTLRPAMVAWPVTAAGRHTWKGGWAWGWGCAAGCRHCRRPGWRRLPTHLSCCPPLPARWRSGWSQPALHPTRSHA